LVECYLNVLWCFTGGLVYDRCSNSDFNYSSKASAWSAMN